MPQPDNADAFYTEVETRLVHSKVVGQTFKIQVMQPCRKRGEKTRFPVVYASDGNLTFDVLKGISHGMQLDEAITPRFILVGIGYPGESPWAGAVLRERDLTFPGFPRFGVDPTQIAGALAAEPGAKSSGGAEDFRQFLAQELIPLIDASYNTSPQEATYFGHSAGGSFGLFSMFTEPELFKNYILVSPALEYHTGSEADGVGADSEFGLELVRRFVQSGKRLPERRLYMAVGAEEEFDTVRARWRFTSSFYRLCAILGRTSVPGLTLRTEVLAGEGHMTVWPIAFMHGIRAFLRQPAM